MFDKETILTLDDKDGMDLDEAFELGLLDDPSESDRLLESVYGEEE